MNERDLSMEVTVGHWNRRIYNAYWIIAGLATLLASVNLFLTQTERGFFLRQYVLLPAGLMLTILLLAEGVRWWTGRYNDYVTILIANLLAAVIVFIHSSMPMLICTFFLPILVSGYFYRSRKVYFAYALSSVSYLIVYMSEPRLHGTSPAVDVFTALSVLVIVMLITLGIMRRGLELIEHLRQTKAVKDELLVQTALMEKLTKTDALTGLYNHMAFHEYLEEMIVQSERCGMKLQAAVFDIDNFKSINDTYGHRTGDVVLARVAQTIRETLAPDDFVARYGGEEFVAIFLDQETEMVFQAVDRARARVAELELPELMGRTVTISVGLHEHRQGAGKEELFVGADSALYVAKKTGKNRVVVYRPEMAEWAQLTDGNF
jgi:diguanylate cyclase (GGDEF)-like protein